MPHHEQPECLALTEEERLLIRTWVENGSRAAWPRPPAPPSPRPSGSRWARSCSLRLRGLPPAHRSGTAQCVSAAGRLGLFEFGQEPRHANRRLRPAGRGGVNGSKFNNNMPSFPLGDQDVANVLTYVYNSFGNAGFGSDPDEVKAVRAQGPPRPLRRPNRLRRPPAPLSETRKKRSAPFAEAESPACNSLGRNEAQRQPVLNLHLARAYLTASDPAFVNALGRLSWSNCSTSSSVLCVPSIANSARPHAAHTWRRTNQDSAKWR